MRIIQSIANNWCTILHVARFNYCYHHKIVSAAPPHSSSSSFPKFTIEDFTTEKNDIEVDDLIKSLKCIQNVFGNAVGDSDLKPAYEEYKQSTEIIVKNHLIKCRDLEIGSEEKSQFV